MWVAVRFPFAVTEFLASPDYVAWRRDNRTFESLAATQAGGSQTVLLNGTHAAELHAVRVSANFLPTFGFQPVIGRNFKLAEELPDAAKSVLLSYKLWRNHYDRDPRIVGKTISLDGQAYQVIGVLTKDFIYPMDVPVDVVSTLPVSPDASHHARDMSIWAVYGRLKPGVTLEAARTDLQRLFQMSKADMPQMFAPIRASFCNLFRSIGQGTPERCCSSFSGQ